MTGGIFISYRRDDSAGYAGRLYDRLAARFGSDRVFMDVEGIEPGTDFVVAIEKAVSSCAVLIVLIGDEWLSVTDASGKPRLDDPHDFIRLETATALKRDIRVVPVLLEGTPMPPSDALPEELRMLTRRQGVEISHKQWESSTGDLIGTLERILEQADPSDAAVPAKSVEAPAPAPEPAGVPAETAAPAPHHPTGAGTGGDTRPSSPGKLLGAAVLVAAVGGLAWYFGTRPDDTPAPAPAPAVQTPPAVPPVVAAEAPTGEPKLVALQPKVDFGSIMVETRGAGAVRFGNEGTADARVSAPRLDGVDAGSFRIIVNTCEGTLAPGRTCEVNLGFHPLSSGTRKASLIVGLADGTQQLSVALAGTGSPPPSSAAPAAAPNPPAPRVTTLNARPEDGGTRICYRASAADSVELLPSPGMLENVTSDCVRVAIDGPTRFTLVVTNQGGSSRKTVLARPKPVATATMPDSPTSGSAQPTSATDSLPSVGEQWQYRSKGKWPTSPKRRFQVTARSVSGQTVQDLLVQTEPPPRFRGETNGTTGAGFVSWNEIGTEFSPYLGAFVTLSEGRSWRNVPTPDMGAYWTQWYTEAKVLGQETVSVPAGRFAATKVEVWSSRRATGSSAEAQLEPVRIRYLVWYAREAKRYVRMERKVISANGSEIENDTFELVAHGGG
ncbi:MAG: TIR domain-containing protein [Rhodocyclaceae bacterium]